MRNGANTVRGAPGALFGSPLGRLLYGYAGLLAACLFLGPPLRLFLRNGMDLRRRPT